MVQLMPPTILVSKKELEKNQYDMYTHAFMYIYMYTCTDMHATYIVHVCVYMYMYSHHSLCNAISIHGQQ